jgi:eukaryotic-like serine/threonine-protein kinase
MKFRAAIFIILILIPVFTGCSKKFHLDRGEELQPPEWNFVRLNPSGTASIKSDFKGELNLIWENKASEGLIGPLTAAGGDLIFSGTKGRVYFYDLETGKYDGRFKAKRPIQTGLTVIDSLAYLAIGPNHDKFLCLNLYNQHEVWDRDLKDVTGAPIIIEDRLYVGSGADKFFCLDRLNGDIIWQDSAEAKTLAGPSADNNMVYFPFEDGSFRGYEARKGDLIFEINLKQPLVSKVVVGDNVYVTGADGGLFAIDRTSGEIIWQKNFPYPFWTSPALDNERLYIGDNGGSLRAIDPTDGDVIWEFKSNGVIVSSPVVVGDYVVFGSLDRWLYCLEKSTGRLTSKREFKRGIRFPAVGYDGRVYVAADDGTIQCFGN